MNIKFNKGFLIILTVIFIHVASCKKGLTVYNNTDTTATGWMINGVTKHQYSCAFDSGSSYLAAKDTVVAQTIPVSSLVIRFNKRPVQGIYSVMGYNYFTHNPVIADTMVEISGRNNLLLSNMGPYGPARDFDFVATGYNMPKITVNLVNNKVQVKIPELWVYRLGFPNLTPPPYSDSVKLSGVIREN